MSSSDRELLELAAKAAGIQGEWSERGRSIVISSPGMSWEHWRPLEDDGDALRLAVALELEMYYGDNGSDEEGSIPCAGVTRRDLNFVCMEGFGRNQSKGNATRRAITRAAAEIGRRMPC